ncbi:MAG: nitronate monooxygenase, partial [Lachnospiraceae bacterium]|nr:nitronate monooxygenase [Lachnospiraceae bacterium]
ITGMSTGHPVRQIRNQMTREYLRLEKEGAGLEELEYLTLGSLRKAVIDGDTANGTLMAGQIAGLVGKQQTCREIIEELMKETQVVVKKENELWAK